MEPGKIRLINSGGQSDAGFTQTIAVSVGNEALPRVRVRHRSSSSEYGTI